MKSSESNGRMDFQQEDNVEEQKETRKRNITATMKKKVKLQWIEDDKKKARKSALGEKLYYHLESTTRDISFQLGEYRNRLFEMNDCISRYRKENEEKKAKKGKVDMNGPEQLNGRANFLSMQVAITNFVAARTELERMKLEKKIYNEFIKD